jgi:hypothetical protein
MSTKPKAVQLESMSGLPPLARQWIKALVEEAVEQVASKAASAPTASAPAQPTKDVDLINRVDDLSRRIKYIEDVYDEDQKYSLTKGKVIALLKKHGIE